MDDIVISNGDKHLISVLLAYYKVVRLVHRYADDKRHSNLIQNIRSNQNHFATTADTVMGHHNRIGGLSYLHCFVSFAILAIIFL